MSLDRETASCKSEVNDSMYSVSRAQLSSSRMHPLKDPYESSHPNPDEVWEFLKMPCSPQ
jgi:hypothetical protein